MFVMFFFVVPVCIVICFVMCDVILLSFSHPAREAGSGADLPARELFFCILFVFFLGGSFLRHCFFFVFSDWDSFFKICFAFPKPNMTMK